jgi:hypothetical protein
MKWSAILLYGYKNTHRTKVICQRRWPVALLNLFVYVIGVPLYWTYINVSVLIISVA